jgi:hypothetical protein
MPLRTTLSFAADRMTRERLDAFLAELNRRVGR